MSIVKRAANNVFWLFVTNICARFLTFWGTLYLARVLGTEGFGIYSLAMALSLNLWFFVDLGITNYGTREVARNHGGAKELLDTLNSLRIFMGVIFFIGLSVILIFYNMPSLSKWALIAGGFYLIADAVSPAWMLRGIEKMKYIAYGEIALGIFFISTLYLLVKSPADTVNAVLFRSIGFLLASLVCLYFSARKFNINFRFKFMPALWVKHCKESWYYGTWAGLDTLSKYIPTFFLGALATNKELGLFTAPQRFLLLLIGLRIVVSTASYPILANLFLSDKEKYIQTHISVQKIMFFISMPIGILGSFLSRDLIVWLYGANYAEGAGIFSLMIWLVPIVFISNDYSKSLCSAGFQKINTLANVAGVALTAAVCYFLVKNYGGRGAAIAMMMGEILCLLVSVVTFAVKIHNYNPLDADFFKITAASIIMTGIVLQIDSHVAIKILIGACLYFVLSFIFGLISGEMVQKFIQSLFPRYQFSKKGNQC